MGWAIYCENRRSVWAWGIMTKVQAGNGDPAVYNISRFQVSSLSDITRLPPEAHTWR